LTPVLLFLIGYRGAGKTTVARLLAERLGWKWLDADDVLESRFGRSIRAIFADEGETGFRDKETAVLADLCKLQSHVVATGGGVVLRQENCKQMRGAGLVVWLCADAKTLWKRLQTDASTAQRRPDLTCGGLAEIEQLLAVRQPPYAACAHLTVDTAGREPLEVAAEILQNIDRL
jgi:shikimate kinase